MKILIASDIHGSAKYCRMLLDRFEEEKAGRLLLLGDLLYHGPRNDLPEGYAPKEVIRLLNEMSDSILCVRGNCDAEVDQMVLRFPILSETAWICDGACQMVATHGHHEIGALPTDCVLLTGHTHVPVAERAEGYVHINPGSVTIPKEDSPKSYVLYSDGEFSFRRLTDDSEYMHFSIR